MKHLCPVRLCLRVSLLLALLPLPIASQGVSQVRPTVVPDQITVTVDPAQLQPLPHHHPLWANAANDLGPASADLTFMLVLQRSAEQEVALQQLLIDQKNPSSPEFHHWLTPVEFGQRFGLSDSDLQSIRAWIESQGLTVQWIATGRNFIGFGGPAATVGRAFATTVHNYRVRGDQRTSVSSDPMIPAALAPVIKSIHGLYTIPDKPASFVSVPQIAAGPDLTLSNGKNYVTPADFDTIYDLLQGSVVGTYPTIGIVARSRTNPADFTNFMAVADTSFPMPTEVVPTAFGGVDPGPALTSPPIGNTSVGEQLEATLDVARAGSVARGSNLLIVTATTASGGIGDDTQYLVQTTPVPAQIINISYGDCESDAGSSGVQFWDTLFQQAAAEGISVFVSSGDSGASGCEASFVAPVANPPAISPNYICSSSYATCVGGTEFNDASNPAAYWNTAYGTNLGTARSYIPEGGWNEPTASSGISQLASSGGGVSSIIATPAWQAGPGVPAARAGRYTPDISLTASCHDAYFGCMAAAGGDCVVTNGSFRFVGMCGTSAAAPSMAGVAALIVQNAFYPVGNVNPDIYALAQSRPATFHDATPASSGVATCDINTPSMCNNSTPGPTGLTGGQAGYALTTGFDLVTGLGSPDISVLLSNFGTALPAPTVTLTPSLTTIAAGQPLTITVQVAGTTSQPTPTGTVTLTGITGYSPPATTLSNGQATFSIPALTIPGSIAPTAFTAKYVPDLAGSAVFGRASGTTTVNVNLITPTLTMVLSSANITTAQNLTVNVTIGGGSGNPAPTGAANLYTLLNSTPGYTAAGTFSGGAVTFNLPAGVLPAGSVTIEVNYVPDTNSAQWFAVTPVSQIVTVTGGTKTTPSITATLSAQSITFGGPENGAVSVAGPAGSPAPTGTLNLSGNGQAVNLTLTAGSAQFPVSWAFLPAGTDTLTISYFGDANYNPANTTATVVVSKATSVVVVTPSATTITTAQNLPVVVAVSGASGAPSPGGTVTLGSGAYSSVASATTATIFSIAAGALALGTDTLTASYPGDSNYNPASGTALVVVTAPPPPPSFTLGATAVTIAAPGATTGNTSTVTITPANGFTGSVTLTASVTTSPAGAQDPPTVSFGSTSPVNITGTAAGTATLAFATTAPSTGALIPAPRPGSRWLPFGETALAGILLFGLRARRRRWRATLSSVLLLAALASAIAACGGGGGSSNPPPISNPGTTPGTYVVTINATATTFNASTTVNVVVQ